jgi:hypothetical protein
LLGTSVVTIEGVASNARVFEVWVLHGFADVTGCSAQRYVTLFLLPDAERGSVVLRTCKALKSRS